MVAWQSVKYLRSGTIFASSLCAAVTGANYWKKNVLAEELQPVRVQYLLIGSGPSAYSALRTIRYLEQSSRVLMITDSHLIPHDKYPLNYEAWYSPEFLDDFEYESRFSSSSRNLFYQPEEFYLSPYDLDNCDEYGGQAFLKNHRIALINTQERSVSLSNGDSVMYDKCLFTPGSITPKLPFEGESSIVYTLDTLGDFVELKKKMDGAKDVVVIGNSLRCLEFAVAIQMLFKGDPINVTVLCPEKDLLNEILPESVVQWLKKELKGLGITIVERVEVNTIKASKTKERLQLKVANKATLECDVAVNMLPRIPRTEVATASGLETDEFGVKVDSTLKARDRLYIAGSAASIYHPSLQRRCRFDVPDNSVWSGRFAAFNMMGKTMPYFKLPRNMADFGPDLGFDAIGDLDASLDTLVYFVHKKPDAKIDGESDIETATSELPENIERCAVLYFKEGTLVGVATLGAYGRMYMAENMISSGVTEKEIEDYVPLLLSDRFKLPREKDEEDDIKL